MYCECGCGQITKIAQRTDKRRGWVKGEHFRCIYGHSPLKSVINYKGVDKWVENNQCHICACGCGDFIAVKPFHYNRGIPKYIHGHYAKTQEMKDKQREYNSTHLGELSPRWKRDRDSVRGRVRCKVDFTKRQKRDIYVRDNGICQMCEMICLLDVHVDHPWKVNIDHIISVNDGGTNEISNGQVLCLSCHKLKHSAVAKRMNSGKPVTGNAVGNPEPSSQSEKVQRLPECSDTLNNRIQRPSRKGRDSPLQLETVGIKVGNVRYKGAVVFADDGVPANAGYFINFAKYVRLIYREGRNAEIGDFVKSRDKDDLVTFVLWAGNLINTNLARGGLLQNADTY